MATYIVTWATCTRSGLTMAAAWALRAHLISRWPSLAVTVTRRTEV